MIDAFQIEADVRATLHADPRLPAPKEIAIAVEDGHVTLRGTVGSFAQRRAAVADARTTEGVSHVKDELRVRLLDAARREDAEIRGAALQALMWDVQVPSAALDVKVSDGWVTLEGHVDHQFQSDEAFEAVARLAGVADVTNEIRVVEPR
jgi:osmotically-inducible protein OsmY